MLSLRVFLTMLNGYKPHKLILHQGVSNTALLYMSIFALIYFYFLLATKLTNSFVILTFVGFFKYIQMHRTERKCLLIRPKRRKIYSIYLPFTVEKLPLQQTCLLGVASSRGGYCAEQSKVWWSPDLLKSQPGLLVVLLMYFLSFSSLRFSDEFFPSSPTPFFPFVICSSEHQ